MAGQLLRDTPSSGVVRLTISNPEKQGALDPPILDALATAVEELGAPGSGVRALILTGTAQRFSSGYDLGGLDQLDHAEFVRRAEALIAHPFTAAIDALAATDLPTIAALPGATVGGGLELALACDLRVAAEGIVLAMPPTKLGLVYPHTGLRRFLDTIGAARTRELFLLGRDIDPQTALEWGLITAVAPPSALQETAMTLAQEMAAGAPLAVAGTKRVLRALLQAEGEVEESVAAELMALRRASLSSDDLHDGVRAFIEKRPPVWRGK